MFSFFLSPYYLICGKLFIEFKIYCLIIFSSLIILYSDIIQILFRYYSEIIQKLFRNYSEIIQKLQQYERYQLLKFRYFFITVFYQK